MVKRHRQKATVIVIIITPTAEPIPSANYSGKWARHSDRATFRRLSRYSPRCSKTLRSGSRVTGSPNRRRRLRLVPGCGKLRPMDMKSDDDLVPRDRLPGACGE